MDKYGNVYQEVETNVPDEDKARLEGYLIAKAEAGELERLKKYLEQKNEEGMRNEERKAEGGEKK